MGSKDILPALFDESGQPAIKPEPLSDPTYFYVNSLSLTSQEAIWKRLRTVARLFEIDDPETFPWHHLRAAQVARIRQRLMQPYGPTNKRAAPATVNLTLAVFRGIAREARNANAMSDEEYRRVVRRLTLHHRVRECVRDVGARADRHDVLCMGHRSPSCAAQATLRLPSIRTRRRGALPPSTPYQRQVRSLQSDGQHAPVMDGQTAPERDGHCAPRRHGHS